MMRASRWASAIDCPLAVTLWNHAERQAKRRRPGAWERRGSPTMLDGSRDLMLHRLQGPARRLAAQLRRSFSTMLNLSAMQKAFFLALFLSPPVAVAMRDSAGQVAGQIVAQPPGGRRPGVVQPPRDTGAAPETGTARLQGVVVGGEAGQPLRRAIVRISGEGIREGRVTTTDAEGRWELAELPAGRYTLMASKAGYVTLQ